MLRNVLGVLAGLVAGAILNTGLVMAGPLLIPTPAGVDVTDAASLRATAHLLEPRHFIFPFLAHALGTFVGAVTAYLVAGSRPSAMAWLVGAITLAGGVAAAFMIPAPAWFVVLDLVGAYLPMTWLGITIGRRLRASTGQSRAHLA